MKNTFLFKRGEFYYLQYFDEYENKKRISTGCKKKTEAIEFLMDFEENRKPKLKQISLKEFFELYKNHIKTNLSNKYLKDIQTTETKLILFTGNIPLLKINALILDRFISSIAIYSKFQSVKHYNNLRSAFNKAILWGYLEVNPILRIKPAKPPKNNPLFIDEFELGKILEKESDDLLRDAYKFGFYSGMRLGEIVNLKWNAVELSERIIKVQNTETFTTKGKRERIIPINDKLYNVLLSRLPKVMTINKDEYVFNKKGFRFNGDFISKRFKKALRETDLNQNIHLHSLRHSFASNLVMSGISLYTIQNLLGHRDAKTSQIYSHLKMDYLKEAVKVLDR